MRGRLQGFVGLYVTQQSGGMTLQTFREERDHFQNCITIGHDGMFGEFLLRSSHHGWERRNLTQVSLLQPAFPHPPCYIVGFIKVYGSDTPGARTDTEDGLLMKEAAYCQKGRADAAGMRITRVCSG